MRFDDRLSTVLNGDYESPRARALRWQQLTDIVAQAGPSMTEPVAARVLRLIAVLGRDVPPATFSAHAAAIAENSRFAPLLILLSAHSPAASAAVMPSAQMAEEEWLIALPHLGPVARSALRRRDDLPPRVVQALTLFAAGDMTLGSRLEVQQTAEPQATDIRDLVRRIEEYRQRQNMDRPGLATPAAESAALHINFETDAAARIIDADVRGRGRFVGIEMGQPAAAFESGCDAGTARIIGKRGRIAGGRLLLQGHDQWAGTWLCEAEPRFAQDSGAFLGYHGILRRPEPHEVITPHTVPAATSDTIFAPDMLRQLMHELRSPLNAVAGFAQLIEGQYAGPVAGTYREAARTILLETDRLAAVVDEIDLLAQLSGRDAGGLNSEGAARIGVSIQAALAAIGEGQHAIQVQVVGTGDIDEPVAAASAHELERLLRLWLQPLAHRLEPLRMTVAASPQGDSVEMLLAVPESASFGIAFAAAQEIARQLGGSLTASDGQHILNLPLVAQVDMSGERVG